MAGGAAAIGVAALLAVSAAHQGAPRAVAPSRSDATQPARPATIPPTVIGMNLGQGWHYSQEWIFADLVRNNGALMSDNQPHLVGIKVDGGGHPYDVPKGKDIALMLQASGVWKNGDYRCSISPGWSVNTPLSGTVSGGDENFKLTIPKQRPGFLVLLNLRAKQDGARLDKASCMPTDLPPDALFTPQFLEDMKSFKVIRFMDWMQTNNAPPQTWADRPKPSDFSQLHAGMSVEYMVALANQLNADPWFTLPFDADEAYYRNFAIYVRDHLAPGRKAYVELSNEVWNPGFKQAQDAAQRGKERYSNVDFAGDFYYADRVKDLMKIWGDVFAGQMPRIVRVAGGQVGWKERAEALLTHKDLWKSVDAYAVAPYFGTGIQDIVESGPARVTKGLDRLPPSATKVVDQMVGQKAAVEKLGIRYIAYEGGSDIIGYSPDAARDAVTMNHDPRMYDIYTNFLEDWRKRIGGLLVLYNGTSGTNYGHMDYTGQPRSETPKMRAVLDFMARHPQ
jgi:hypothetical protein